MDQVVSKSDIKKLTENISNEFQNILKFLVEDVKEIDPSLLPKNVDNLPIEIISNNLETEFHNDSNSITIDECVDLLDQLDQLEKDFDNLPGARKPEKINMRKFTSVSSLSGSLTNLTSRLNDRTLMPSSTSIDTTHIMPPPSALPSLIASNVTSLQPDETDETLELTENEMNEFNDLRKVFVMKLQTGMQSGINENVKEVINQSMEKLLNFLKIMVTELTALYGSNNNDKNDTIDEEILNKLKTLNEILTIIHLSKDIDNVLDTEIKATTGEFPLSETIIDVLNALKNAGI